MRQLLPERGSGVACASVAGAPAVAAGQKVTLALVKTDGSERFLLETESDGSSLTFPATALTAATSYLARVEVDGAESLLTHDGSGFTGPLVTTP